MTMQKRSLLIGGLGAILLSATLMTGAYAQTPASAGISEKIVAAKTKADHEQLAAEFEKQANSDKVAAERHRKMAQAYTTAPWVKASGAGMVTHCKALIADYEKAEKLNTEMAKLHREVGAKLP